MFNTFLFSYYHDECMKWFLLGDHAEYKRIVCRKITHKGEIEETSWDYINDQDVHGLPIAPLTSALSSLIFCALARNEAEVVFLRCALLVK